MSERRYGAVSRAYHDQVVEKKDSEIATLKAQRDELLELLKWSDEKLGPEINPSNYDHQDVCELNANMVEVTLAIRAAIAKIEGAKE